MNWWIIAAVAVAYIVVMIAVDRGHEWAKAVVRLTIFVVLLMAALGWLNSVLRGEFFTWDGFTLLVWALIGLQHVGALPTLYTHLSARRARRNREQARDSRG